MLIYLKNNSDKFHLDLILERRSLGLLLKSVPPCSKKNNKMSSDMRTVPDPKVKNPTINKIRRRDLRKNV